MPGLLVVRSPVHRDARGWFTRAWQREKLVTLGPPDFGWVQDTSPAFALDDRPGPSTVAPESVARGRRSPQGLAKRCRGRSPRPGPGERGALIARGSQLGILLSWQRRSR
nr:hypothetical protein [Janibacter sp. DB-40]